MHEEYLKSQSEEEKEAFSGLLGRPEVETLTYDLGETRIRKMDEAGIDFAQISLTTPGAEFFPAEMSKQIAAEANDRLADAIKRHPDRFGGYISLAPEDPEWSVREIDRAAENGLFGWTTLANYNGKYLDDPKYFPILEKLASLHMPVYLHPNFTTWKEYGEFGYCLNGPSLGFTAVTQLVYMRLIHRGVFDKLPDLKVILGHDGEGLPFFKNRMDTAWRQNSGQPLKSIGITLQHEPSYYLDKNTYLTTSGNFLFEALRCSIDVCGLEKCMMATDMPYENVKYAVSFIADNDKLTQDEKEAILYKNAENLGFGPR